MLEEKKKEEIINNILFIIDNASFCLSDRQKLHFLYGLDLEKSDILLLDSAVLMLKLDSDFAKLLNASELFGVANIFATSDDLSRFRINKHKKIIPISRLDSIKNLAKKYDIIIKL